MLDLNKVYCGDCLEVMKDIDDKSIDLVVTSPPYGTLRDYEGYDFNFEVIANELYRVIKIGGVVVWVVGDQTIDGSESGESFRQALYFKEICFNLHDTMIYEKINYIPLTHNRYEQCFEYMFVFSKGKPKTFNPIRIDKENFKRRIDKTFHRNSTGDSKKKEYIRYKKIKLKNNIWSYATGKSNSTSFNKAFNHPAIFPEKLATDHITSWSNQGDIILDPMCGSGTTCAMAQEAGRKYIGIDVSQKYVDIAKERLRRVPLLVH